MSKAFFITGTDTGVGKTYVSCGLLRAFAAQGQRVVGMKPVAAGCERVGDTLISADARQLQAASNVQVSMDEITKYAFEPAIAPHIAAKQTGVEIQLPSIVQAFKALQAQADVVIVEGVGGFCVPLNTVEDTADMAVALDIPLILVVGLRLGCLNHALLTAEAIAQRGLTLAGWVANHVEAGMEAQEENIIALRQRINAPLIAHLRLQPVAEVVNFSLAKIS
jgi:dethiobiotin synthetase